MENLEKKYNVSRETLDKLKVYEGSLVQWQEKLNLVSNSSLVNAWERHFIDSIQLYQYIPENAKSLYDLGSGAGFPGMVLAIMAEGRTPSLNVSLVESISKKTLYLNEVKDITSAKVNVVNKRLEELPSEKIDIITSRALTALNKLFEYSFRFCHENTVLIFPKGKKHLEEIKEAKKDWLFDVSIHKSDTSDEAAVLIVKNLKNKKGRSVASRIQNKVKNTFSQREEKRREKQNKPNSYGGQNKRSDSQKNFNRSRGNA